MVYTLTGIYIKIWLHILKTLDVAITYIRGQWCLNYYVITVTDGIFNSYPNNWESFGMIVDKKIGFKKYIFK